MKHNCMVPHKAYFSTSCQKGFLLRSGSMREQQLARRPELDNPRAILLMCYQNLEPPVKIPKGALRSGAPVMAAFSAAKKAGVEFWQVGSRTVKERTQALCQHGTFLKHLSRGKLESVHAFFIEHRAMHFHVEGTVSRMGMRLPS